MKVAYICADPGIPIFGQKGCSIHVQEVIRALLAKNIEVSLFTPRLGGEIPPDFKGVKVYKLPTIAKVDRAEREKLARSLNDDLQWELSRAEPFDFIYERYSLWSYSGMEYAQKLGIPGILEVNAPLILEQDQHRGLVDRQEAEAIAQRVFKAASNIVAVSSEIRDYLNLYKVDQALIEVIPNGVNPQRFANISGAYQRSNQQFTVGFVGSLKPWHGLPILIEAFARFHSQHPQTQLLIVGDGTERDRTMADIKQRNLESAVCLTGAVPPETVPEYLAQMDVAVAPYPASTDFYFSPLKVYEYMAAGLPVVASDLGQISQVIDSGVNGLLVKPGDGFALADALDLLWRSPVLRSYLGNCARKTVLQEYTWERVVEKILSKVHPQAIREVIG
ncbi:group 1 glycosyl transferase [Chondrocystis sp. NIES-4102]|nr:group 1 glycosyl transferase [Chondrocystis sp. NIES-4102]